MSKELEERLAMINVFRFFPGERVQWIVGQPGPDTDDCTIVEDNGGEEVVIDFQVWGRGPVHRKSVKRTSIVWLKGSETSKRYQQWQETRDD